MKRTYHMFPQRPEFEQKFSFKADLPYIVTIMAGMDGQFGDFLTDDVKGRQVQAKRTINVEICDKKVDFFPLNSHTIDAILSDVDHEGTVDFKVKLSYASLDHKYTRVPIKGDSFLVRANLENGVLKMTIHNTEGMGRTDSERIADTIVEEIKRHAPQ